MSQGRSQTVLEVEQKTSTAHRLLNYNGVCSSVHGHNIGWDVTIRLDKVTPPDNMSVDFKDVGDYLDYADHAVLLNKEDPLLDDYDPVDEQINVYETVTWSCGYVDPLGDVVIFQGDPTCEVLADWMSELLVTEIDEANTASVSVAETDKYKVSHGHYVDPDTIRTLDDDFYEEDSE